MFIFWEDEDVGEYDDDVMWCNNDDDDVMCCDDDDDEIMFVE